MNIYHLIYGLNQLKHLEMQILILLKQLKLYNFIVQKDLLRIVNVLEMNFKTIEVSKQLKLYY